MLTTIGNHKNKQQAQLHTHKERRSSLGFTHSSCSVLSEDAMLYGNTGIRDLSRMNSLKGWSD